MSDFGAPVATGVQGPSAGIQTLSSLLGVKQQQLALQQGEQQLQSQQAEATVATLKAQQTQALRNQDWRQFFRPDGSLDVDGAQQLAFKVAPNLAPDFMSRFETMAQGGTATKKAYYSLNQDMQDGLRSIFGSWAGDPKSTPVDLAQQLQAWQANLPKDLQAAGKQISNHTLQIMTGPDLVTGSPKTLEQQKAAALAYSRAGLSTSEVSGPAGLATPAAGTTSTGTKVISTTTNRETGVTSPSNAPPIAEEHQPISLPSGQVAIWNKATNQYEIASGGSARGASGSSGPAPEITAQNDPNRPGANAPAQIQAQWQKALADTNSGVEATRQGDQNYGNSMAVAQDIRALSQSAGGKDIGPGTPEWTKFIGSFTSRLGGSQGVTDVQTLESFLDRQAASMTSAMGLPATNLGNEQARTISGNIGMQVGALRAKNDYNEALAQGLHDYRTGLDKVAGFGGNASPTAVNRFRNQWASVFNPTAIEYKLAMERGDRKVQDAIAKSVTPAQARRIRADLEAMQSLANTGKLP